MDGGVAKNDFILQTIAKLTGKRVERPVFTEMTALGSALMAGIQAGKAGNSAEFSLKNVCLYFNSIKILHRNLEVTRRFGTLLQSGESFPAQS